MVDVVGKMFLEQHVFGLWILYQLPNCLWCAVMFK